jgi:hypothetical protein
MTIDKTLVFHVGAVPTASWQVQRRLAAHERTLLQQSVRYLSADVLADRVGSGGRLVDDPDGFAGAVDEALTSSATDVLVASHEGTLGRPFGDDPGRGLFPTAAPALAALAQATHQYRRLIVLSLCPPEDFVESYYLRLINTGRWVSFDDWLETVDLDDLSWTPLYETLADVFGADSVCLLE